MGENKICDLVIIGAGPAGLSASLYASRYGIKHMVIGISVGGLIAESHRVDNYLGVESLSGFELAQKMLEHAKKYSPEMINSEVISIKKIENKRLFEIKTQGSLDIFAKTIVLATGTKRRQLSIPGEKELEGRGVSYCATCDGFFYKNKIVAVVGGGNSAVGAAVHLSQVASKVFLIYRKAELPAEEYWKKLLAENEKIEIIYNTNVLEVMGKEKVEKIKLDKKNNGQEELLLEGLFIEVGSDPSWDFAQDLNLKTDEGGYLKIGEDGTTNIEGIWAAGDITTGSNKFRQAITAAAEGAIAARSAFDYLKKQY
jgi:thioredoxin reductase (NADPH)